MSETENSNKHMDRSNSNNKKMMAPSESFSSMSTASAPDTASAPRQSEAVARKQTALFVRVLFQYLERVDGATLELAKRILQDCVRKHQEKDSKFKTLSDAVGERVRNAVGEAHWLNAEKIHRRLIDKQKEKAEKTINTIHRGVQKQKNHSTNHNHHVLTPRIGKILDKQRQERMTVHRLSTSGCTDTSDSSSSFTDNEWK